ncbi:MAG TPA: hypothetical protein VNQ79_06750 [Blastocatellia bacterium]|nr:hypothetical protein [Blastocatellia bacterium]
MRDSGFEKWDCSSQALALDNDFPASRNEECWPLTVLSFGAGQDSTAILYRLAYDSEFRSRFGKGCLLVLMADTGDEHRHTYAHVARVRRFCREQGIEFHFISRGQGFHSAAWASLHTQWERNETVGLKAGVKSCTDNLKIKVFYRFLCWWLQTRLAMPFTGSECLKHFARRYGKVRVIIGFAKGEEHRITDPRAWKEQWKRESVTMLYPLIEVGWTRADCVDYIRSTGQPVPFPSNCRNCPYSSKLDLLWLFRNDRASYERWVAAEERKLRKFSGRGGRNNTVWGKKTLPEVLNEAISEFGHLSDEHLTAIKFTHGHCVASRY